MLLPGGLPPRERICPPPPPQECRSATLSPLGVQKHAPEGVQESPAALQVYPLHYRNPLPPDANQFRKFCCLRQVHLAENLPQATHTQNKEKTT